MRVLAAIAYYGTTNEPFVRRLIDEYRSMSYDVDVVVLSEAQKDLDGCEVRVGLPIDDPYSLPFAFRPLFEERRDDYDVFIYSEDDTLIAESAVSAFCWAASVLPDGVVAGFLRTESTSTGSLRCSSVHSRFHWDPTSSLVADGEVFAEFTNEHGAAFMLTREQLATAIDSNGWTVRPHDTLRHDMRVMAAVHPYLNCGLKKVVCTTRLDDFLLPHLTNRYATSTLGVALEEFRAQADVLASIASGSTPATQLVSPTAAVPDPRWDITFWPAPDHDSIASVPPGARAVLSVGVGSGATEAELVARGTSVVGVPFDNVVAASARRRGVETTVPDLDSALNDLDDRSFDAILALDVLHHFEDPADVLRRLRLLLRPGGRMIATVPNVRREQIGSLVRRDARARVRRGFESTRVHPTSPSVVSQWFRSAGMTAPNVVGSSRRPQLVARLVDQTLRVTATNGSPDASEQHRRQDTSHSAHNVPRVSVGLPVYNGERYLRTALDSLLSQSFDDIEVVVCDNASTDATQQICEEYLARDDRVRYLRQHRNMGAAHNYNCTLELARGELFKWAAHDDVCRPDFIRRCVDEFERDVDGELVLVHPRALLIDDEGEPIKLDPDDLALAEDDPVRRFAHVIRHVSAANAVFGLFPRAALERTARIAPHEASDWTLLAELALHGQFRCVDDVLFERRIHDGASLRAILLQGGKRKATLAWWNTDNVTLRGLVPFSVQTSYALFRAVGRAPLTPRQRLRALVAVPAAYWPRLARFHVGRLKKRLRGESLSTPADIDSDDPDASVAADS